MKCRWRIAPIGHSEIECPVVGEHDVHRYRGRDGVLHLVEFADFPAGVDQ